MSTRVEWADEVWNPTTGCAKVSAGCKNCYAEKMTKRLAAMKQKKYHGILTERGRFNGKVRHHEDTLRIPFTWRKPRKVFVNSMSDLFHEDVPFEFIDKVFNVMARTPQHTYQILTKRPERMAEYLASEHLRVGNKPETDLRFLRWHMYGTNMRYDDFCWPISNIWLGTSVENQDAADERIPHLLRCPAAVRFLSCEPLLGAVELKGKVFHGGGLSTRWDYLNGLIERDWDANGPVYDLGEERGGKIHWVIAGGESGPEARPMHPDWARQLRDQCAEAGVAFFFKQWGEWCPASAYSDDHEDLSFETCDRMGWPGGEEVYRVGKKAAGRMLDGRTHEEFP